MANWVPDDVLIEQLVQKYGENNRVMLTDAFMTGGQNGVDVVQYMLSKLLFPWEFKHICRVIDRALKK